MLTLSVFADEIAAGLEEQVAAVKAAGIGAIELRGFDRTNVMKLSDEQVARAAALFKKEGVAVSSIATPIGKVETTDAFEVQQGQMKRAVELAKIFAAPAIRIFSFYVPKGDEHRKWKKEVVDRLGRLVKLAAGTKVKVVLENEEGLWGDTVDRCHDLIEAVKSPQLSLCFDPCNLVIIGPRPYTDAWKTARKHLGYLHVKDWRATDKTIVPAGEGDAEWVPLLGALREAKWEGTIALEPHLAAAGQFAGFSGPDLFRKAHAALTGLLKQANLDYR